MADADGFNQFIHTLLSTALGFPLTWRKYVFISSELERRVRAVAVFPMKPTRLNKGMITLSVRLSNEKDICHRV